ncbi:putative endopeptidase Clp [Helianthus anomalus]
MRRKEDKKERKTNSYLVKNQRKSYYYKLEGTCYEKKSIGIYTLILFFFFFFEPYASKGACTVPKGYNLTLINRLYRERLLFLGQEVDSEISNQLIGLMIYLSIEDDTQDLYLFINSPGGWVIPGVALYDTMQFVQPDVHTICMGSAASMGSFILVGGEITKRLAFPHAWRQWGFYLREKRRLCLRHMKYEY